MTRTRRSVVWAEPPFECPCNSVSQWPVLAASRQCHRLLAPRKPAIERGRTGPRLFKLEGDLDRRFMAGSTSSTEVVDSCRSS